MESSIQRALWCSQSRGREFRAIWPLTWTLLMCLCACMRSEGSTSLSLEFSNTLFYLFLGGVVTKACLRCAAEDSLPPPSSHLTSSHLMPHYGNRQQIAFVMTCRKCLWSQKLGSWKEISVQNRIKARRVQRRGLSNMKMFLFCMLSLHL